MCSVIKKIEKPKQAKTVSALPDKTVSAIDYIVVITIVALLLLMLGHLLVCFG